MVLKLESKLYWVSEQSFLKREVYNVYCTCLKWLQTKNVIQMPHCIGGNERQI